MHLNHYQSQKDQLAAQNSLLKTQISSIKDKISQIQFRPNPQLSDNTHNNLLTPQNKCNKYDDEEILALAKKIDYYKDEIAKKKIQIENNIDLAKIKDLNNRIKEYQDKITDLESENLALVRVYNNQVKGINQASIQLDYHDEEERFSNLIKENKAKYKDAYLKNKQIDFKLKHQRILYSNLNNKINKIKDKIKTIKLNENKRLSINYQDEIAKLEEEIKEEQTNLDKEEDYCNAIKQKQQMTIDQLTDEIIQKREVLKDKGNEIRMIQIKERNDKRKKSLESPRVNSTQIEKESIQTKEEKEEDEKEKDEESNSHRNDIDNDNGFFITANNGNVSDKDDDKNSSNQQKRNEGESNQSEERKDSNQEIERSQYEKKESISSIIINDFKTNNDNDNSNSNKEENEDNIDQSNNDDERKEDSTGEDNKKGENPSKSNNGFGISNENKENQINSIQDHIDSIQSNITSNENNNQTNNHNQPSEEIEENKTEMNLLEALKNDKFELDYGDREDGNNE